MFNRALFLRTACQGAVVATTSKFAAFHLVVPNSATRSTPNRVLGDIHPIGLAGCLISGLLRSCPESQGIRAMEASYDGPKTGIKKRKILERSAAVRAAGGQRSN